MANHGPQNLAAGCCRPLLGLLRFGNLSGAIIISTPLPVEVVEGDQG